MACTKAVLTSACSSAVSAAWVVPPLLVTRSRKVASGARINPAAAATEIDRNRAEFVAGLKTLAEAPQATPRIRDTLKLGEQQWLLFDTAIRSAGRGGSPAREALVHIMTTSENLLLVLDDVTGLYAALG